MLLKTKLRKQLDFALKHICILSTYDTRSVENANYNTYTSKKKIRKNRFFFMFFFSIHTIMYVPLICFCCCHSFILQSFKKNSYPSYDVL